jgi:capsular polysaccharide biosynthesis protein
MPEGDGHTQLQALQALIGGAPMLRLIRERGTIIELLSILENTTPEFAAALIGALDEAAVADLVDKTIKAERSIGTVNLALRELSDRPMPEGDGRTQLQALEGLVGGAPMLRLIRERGTIFELFRILENATAEFAAALIGVLDEAAVADLVDKTIKAERSIGALDLALRELSDRPMPEGDSRTQLQALQALIGGAPMLRLIRERGTILELFKILEHTTPEFAAGLIGALNEAAVADLIDKTIKAERSIGTLSLALRELGDRPMPEGDGRTQLEALQALIGGAPMLRLIRERGTIFELFMILEYTTPEFAAALIDALDEDAVADLIDKTIKAGRSIGTLNLALRELGGRPMPDGDGRTQLQALQGLIGGAPLLRLIRERGTIFELFKILEYTTPEFSAGLIGALNAAAVADLIDKTIKAERSTGTLNYTLRELSGRFMREGDGRTQLQALQELLNERGFWRLAEGAGDLNDLAYLLEDLSSEFRKRALTPDYAPDAPRWVSLMRRGNYFCLARFAKDSLRHLPPVALNAFADAARAEAPELVELSSWAEIGKGMALCESIESAPVRTTLESAALSRIERQDLASLETGGFVETASRLRLTWRYREPLRREIAAKLPELIPPRREWPRDYRLLVGARLLLAIGAESQLEGSALDWLLETFASDLPAAIFSKADADLISAFVWNLGACCAVKSRDRAESISILWNAATQERVFQRLDALIKKNARTDEDKLDILALAGALVYFKPDAEVNLRQLLQKRVTGLPGLLEAAEALTFVPAALATIGLSLIGPPRLAFERSRLERIIAKADEYEAQGPSIHQLIAYLRRVARR